jgi:hypothetical protein
MRDYYEYLQSEEWREYTRLIWKLNGNKCQRCCGPALPGKRAVHHLTYERVRRERLGDCQGLCKECHDFVHGKRIYDPAARAMPWAQFEDYVRSLMKGL